MLKEARRKCWSQTAFAGEIGVSTRVYWDIELGKRAVAESVAERIVQILKTVQSDMTLEALTVLRLDDDALLYESLPGLTAGDQEALDTARECDMAKNYKAAVRIAQRLLAPRRRKTALQPERQMAIRVRLATFLDNAGEHNAAIDCLSAPVWQLCSDPKLARNRSYHIAIARRRLRQWDLAETELRPLVNDKAGLLWAGAMHQLGALYLERNGDIDGPLLDQAMDCFQKSRERWQTERNHREGFSLRRLGQIHAIRQFYPEAIRCFVAAVEVFARCRCRRYVDETREELGERVLRQLEKVRKKSSHRLWRNPHANFAAGSP
jgi:transcriptional regulator with XRE-family HTH domain